MHQRQVEGMILSEDISSKSMVSNRTSAAYKYTGIEGSKICHTHNLQIQKGSSRLCVNRHQAALAYLVKMEGTRNILMIQEAKDIWEFCLSNQIKLTAEYLLGTLNTRADRYSR